ncbi:MAG TPA: acetyl-CoA carboxylase biotin carboxyl carrier protein [Euzebya sp.]|nr:acetyl-CoA carboxylase biotin carboxyl carrier protein [Euzebya sp.]
MSTDEPGTVAGDTPTDQLRQLCEETEALARRMTGTMRRLAVQAGDYRVEVEWEPPPVAGTVMMAAPAMGQAPAADVAPADAEPPGHAITAPLVGTFYRAPEPGAAAFVEEGGPIEAGQHVAIVEAMKIMNRIESDVTGTVRAILVEDGEMVEFGQKLMIVDIG